MTWCGDFHVAQWNSKSTNKTLSSSLLPSDFFSSPSPFSISPLFYYLFLFFSPLLYLLTFSFLSILPLLLPAHLAPLNFFPFTSSFHCSLLSSPVPSFHIFCYSSLHHSICSLFSFPLFFFPLLSSFLISSAHLSFPFPLLSFLLLFFSPHCTYLLYSFHLFLFLLLSLSTLISASLLSSLALLSFPLFLSEALFISVNVHFTLLPKATFYD